MPTVSPHARRYWLRLTALSLGVGIGGGAIAVLLLALINGMTHLAFSGTLSTAPVEGVVEASWLRILVVPLVGALVVGVMARWGSAAIRGHGIPEVMERILVAESRIPARLTVLKPLSAAVAIGTGGPFGAEGPIIATGGSVGSLVGQLMKVTANERKTLLAAGAAAGMAATFDTPVAAVLLAIELLLFEYRARSIIPVALAVSAATAVRLSLLGSGPMFPMPDVSDPTGLALVSYGVVGGIIGFVAVGITRALHELEALYEKLPLHWMWWPLIGALVVGGLGIVEPRILGVGYANIADVLAGHLAATAIVAIVGLKLVAWLVYLASGTSGGTLAPLFTFGSGIGALVGTAIATLLPAAQVEPTVAALVGMAAMFAGATRALLASVVFAFEATRQPLGLLPLLAGCTMAVLISRLLSRQTIMTDKLAQRGMIVPEEYAVDQLSLIPVGQAMSGEVEALGAELTVAGALEILAATPEMRHQGFPVITADGTVTGVVTRHDLRSAVPAATVQSILRREPIVITPEQTLRDAADQMVRAQVGRLPVVVDRRKRKLIGIVTRSDLLLAHTARLRAAEERRRALHLGSLLKAGRRILSQ